MNKMIKYLVDRVIGYKLGQTAIDKAVLAAGYLLPLIGVVDSRLFSITAILYLPIIAYVAFSDGLYLLYPVFFFFYGQLIIPGGIVVFRLYTLAFILRTVFAVLLKLLRKEGVSFNAASVVLSGFLLLTALRYAVFGGFVALGAILDLSFLVCFALEMGGQKGEGTAFLRFLIAFVAAAVASCVAGVFVSDEGGRYLATLNDPNYLGFYLNIAILTVFLHPFFDRLWKKIPILAVLYAALVASESITGVICNAAVVLFCIAVSALTGRFKLKYLIIPTVCCVVAVQLVYISQVHEWGILTEASARVIEKANALIGGDIVGFTTSRSALWRINLEKFVGFGAFDALFGGGLLSAVGRDGSIFPQTSHQEFIDVLVSVGVVGLMIYLAAFVLLFADDLAELRKSGRSERSVAWIRVGIKLIWILYALGLTMFLNGRFFLPIMA